MPDSRKNVLVVSFRETVRSAPEPGNLSGHYHDPLPELTVKPHGAWQFFLATYFLLILAGAILLFWAYGRASSMRELLPAPVVQWGMLPIDENPPPVNSKRDSPLPVNAGKGPSAPPTSSEQQRDGVAELPSNTREPNLKVNQGPPSVALVPVPAPEPVITAPVVSTPSYIPGEIKPNITESQPVLPLTLPPHPPTAPIADSGELSWSGQIDSTGRIYISPNRGSAGMLSGSLPGVPVAIIVSPKNISVVETPGPSNDYQSLVLRGPAGKKMTVTVRWTRVR